MLKNVSNFEHKTMTLPDQVLIFLTLLNKITVDDNICQIPILYQTYL